MKPPIGETSLLFLLLHSQDLSLIRSWKTLTIETRDSHSRGITPGPEPEDIPRCGQAGSDSER